jgi:hypothetical protein
VDRRHGNERSGNNDAAPGNIGSFWIVRWHWR